MKIATLQFAPRLGDVEGNVRRADELLGGLQKGVDLLVLPEMALTGLFYLSFLFLFALFLSFIELLLVLS